jgi:predicted nucleic acid-binding protein
MKLWDTNILSELTRPRPDPRVSGWIVNETELAISAVTVDEIFFGLSWQPNRRVASFLESFLTSRCTVFAVDETVARLGGELRGQLRAVGKVRTQADMWIAATAKRYGLPLVTRNIKDFTDCGIQLIDPFKAA